MFVLRLLSVVVKFGLVAAVIVGGVYVYENRESLGKANSGSGPAPIDYNCSLPGSGFSWLKQDSGGNMFHGGGIFMSTVPSYPRYGVALPVRIREDGTPSSMADVYRMLCAVHPDLGGSGLRPMTLEEKRKLDFGDRPDTSRVDQFPDLYTDGVIRAADEAHIGYEQIRVYLLPPIPQGLRDALATSVASRQTATPTATPTPAPSGETRRYRITVNGYENQIPDGNRKINPDERRGVRFDYRLVGEFVLARATPLGPWTVASSRIVTGDVDYSSLYPADRYQVTLTCEYRSCERLRQASRLSVQVHGDEIVVGWGPFYPQVRMTGTCTDCPGAVDRWYMSEEFFARINSARLPLEKLYVGPLTIERYAGGDIQISFAYGLEQLP